ncbi:MAG: DUF6448 family protein [Fermentimonas sp.]|jgi:hypothetical protein|nr:DUF6448 family protein [Fermentimonas sp.]NLC85677.1 hypothetical protein [Bacteroidales bacterium]MDD2930866.1 DUF6448 family protein [Fermentimonas sp.]MDD3188432.1 DUF6448 family protein [Fermentimonas sp.]MDD3511095.1 DUF6448 family protein [Fermentimonas sp.]
MKTRIYSQKNNWLKSIFTLSLIAFFSILSMQPASAHCDSFDGPALKDAEKALETNNVDLILKWINADMEDEVVPLFHKTYSLRNGDKEIYEIVKKHFYETFVRLHREMEGATFTGLKPAGSVAPITMMSDKALETGDFDSLLKALNNHINGVLQEKFDNTEALYKVKDNSVEEGRKYVEAYVDYTHSVEAVHDILLGGGGHSH